MSMYDSRHKTRNKIVVLVGLFLAISVGMFVDYIVEEPGVPVIDYGYWGNSLNDTKIRKFTINISDDVLEDLKYRLTQRRPIMETWENTGNALGLQSKTLQEILSHWINKYDWRKREQILNKYSHYQTTIAGLNIHFLHIKSNCTKKSYPLLMLHGWPSTFREFYDIIPTLLKGNEDFELDLIIPSLPGFIFSEPSIKPGLGTKEMAILFKTLMNRLNYEKFYIFGNDIGTLIGADMSILFPENVLGYYNMMCVSFRKISFIKYGLETFIPKNTIQDMSKYSILEALPSLWKETGYLHYQATKSDALGVAMNDSPAGLAAYLLNIVMIGSDTDNYMKSGLIQFNYDELIDLVMLYWVTGSTTSSFRSYVDNIKHTLYQHPVSKTIPISCPKIAKDIFYQASWIYRDKYATVVQSTLFENAGHFLLLEEDKENKIKLAEDILTSLQKMQKIKSLFFN